MTQRSAHDAQTRRPAIALASEEGRLREVEAIPLRDPSPSPLPDGGGKRTAPEARIQWRRFASAFFAVLSLVALAYPFLPQRYEASASVVLQPTDADGQADRTMSHPMDENAIQSVIDLIASPMLADAVIARHDLASDPEFGKATGILGTARDWIEVKAPWTGAVLPRRKPVDRAELRQRLQDHLQVYRDKKSYTIRMGYWSSSPAKAAVLSGALLEAYLDEQRSRKRQSLTKLHDWLAGRVELLTGRYDASKRKVSEYLTSSGLIDVGAQLSLEHRLQVLSNEAAQARARFIDASTRAASLEGLKATGELGNAAEVLASPSIQRLKEAMATAFAKTAVWANETGAFERQIATESERIVAAARTEAASWSSRETQLQGEVGSIRATMVQRRVAEQRLQELQRSADSDRAVMDDGLTRLKGMTSRTEMVGADSDVLAMAEQPVNAAFPKPLLTLLASLFLATLVGLLFVWRPVLDAARRLVAA